MSINFKTALVIEEILIATFKNYQFHRYRLQWLFKGKFDSQMKDGERHEQKLNKNLFLPTPRISTLLAKPTTLSASMKPSFRERSWLLC